MIAAVFDALSAAEPVAAFVNFESPHTRPVAVSQDGRHVFAVNTPDNRVSVYDASTLERIAEVPVGLEPVGLAPRPGKPELWVVNHLSDTVDVIDTGTWRVDATIPVGDEPASIAFTPDGAKAYVTLSQENTLVGLDAAARIVATTVSLETPPSFNTQDPRAMTLDRTGSLLYVVPFESGNRTRGADPAGSDELMGTIVPDPSLSDTDLFVVRVSDDAIVGQAQNLGTILTGVAISPDNSKLYVTGWDARNLLRTVESLGGRPYVNTLTILDRTSLSTIAKLDLDAPLYRRSTAVAQPSAIETDHRGRLWIAAQGNDEVILLDADGRQLDRVPVGTAPRGLAMHPRAPWLYVFNRLSHDLTMIDTGRRLVLDTVPLGYDPTPSPVTAGRRFLYTAEQSGDGSQACVSCHTDGHHDNITWDLGTLNDPKGPMFTQSLRGLALNAPYHWRGEKKTLRDFNAAFADVFNGSPLSETDNARLAAYMETIHYPPNPNLHRDGSLSSALAECGSQLFNAGFPDSCPPPRRDLSFTCVQCHAPPHGSNHEMIPGELLLTRDDMEVTQLRGLHEKVSFLHDGRHRTIFDLLSRTPPFPPLSIVEKRALEAFLLEFPTVEHHAAVGIERTINAANCPGGVPEAETMDTIVFLEQQAALDRVDLTVAGTDSSGARVHLLFDPAAGTYLFDRTTKPQTATRPGMIADACGGGASYTFTGWPEGTGVRARDRDLDRLVNQFESDIGTDPADPDTDDDLLADGDELDRGTQPTDPDSDDDGALDGQEVADGTDPTDPASWLRWLRIGGNGNGDIELVWTTSFGRRYTVRKFDGQRAPADPGQFGDLYTTPAPEDESPEGTEAFVDASGLPRPGRCRFYIVEALPQN